jgi:hypothetical protein
MSTRKPSAMHSPPRRSPSRSSLQAPSTMSKALSRPPSPASNARAGGFLRRVYTYLFGSHRTATGLPLSRRNCTPPPWRLFLGPCPMQRLIPRRSNTRIPKWRGTKPPHLRLVLCFQHPPPRVDRCHPVQRLISPSHAILSLLVSACFSDDISPFLHSRPAQWLLRRLYNVAGRLWHG